MNRELVLAALAEDPSTLQNPLQSRDSQLMVDALRAFETDIDMDERSVRITPAQELIGSTSIACGLAGTVMRFVPPVAALALGPVSFDGDPYARKRPMSALVQALRDLGADITDLSLPFTVHGAGSLPGGRVELDASASSQFVSALLLAAPRFENGAHIVHTGESLPSQPHIEMTVAALAARGVSVEQPADNEWLVSPGPNSRQRSHN
jgi:3-phosphoshikimate 1-carboxyvinyltransferase